MKVKLVTQPQNSNLCGQACVATIAGKSIEDSIKAFGGKSGKTRTRDVVYALHTLGVECGDKLTRISKKTGKTNCCIVKLHFDNTKNTHWTVFYNGLFYDPALGILKDYSEGTRQTSFLPIEMR